MVDPSAQTYANHRRYFPLFHYFAFPISAVNVIVAGIVAVRDRTPFAIWSLIFALGVSAAFVAFRAMVLVVQRRIIRLEERLRLAVVLPDQLRARVPELRLAQLVGLRFASDSELPTLVERCLRGELQTSEDVKRAITNWRPDFLRA